MGKVTPLISVIIPNHNYGRYLGQAIESVLRQSSPPHEVIVVDDGSTDNSLAVLRGYHDRIRWFQQDRQGVSAARNRGIRESRGRLLAFLDSDDVWHPEKLARQVARFTTPAIGMVGCGVQRIDPAGRLLGVNLPERVGLRLDDIALLRWSPGGSSMVIRRECLERVGLFDPELSTSADVDLARRIACHTEMALVPEPLVFYRQHRSSMHRSAPVFERDMLRVFSNLFLDPAAAAVHPLRRRCYGRLFMQLAGAYGHAGRWDKCVGYAWWGLLTWPPTVAALAAFPLRRLRSIVHRRGDEQPWQGGSDASPLPVS